MLRRWWHRLAGHTQVEDLGRNIKAAVVLHCHGCGTTWVVGRDKAWIR